MDREIQTNVFANTILTVLHIYDMDEKWFYGNRDAILNVTRTRLVYFYTVKWDKAKLSAEEPNSFMKYLIELANTAYISPLATVKLHIVNILSEENLKRMPHARKSRIKRYEKVKLCQRFKLTSSIDFFDYFGKYEYLYKFANFIEPGVDPQPVVMTKRIDDVLPEIEPFDVHFLENEGTVH